MVIKQILEGARRFKPAPRPETEGQPGTPAQTRIWRWPEWPRLFGGRKDKYLIRIRPRQSPQI